MPRKGFKSITIPDDVYDFFFDEWKRHQEQYRIEGVRSFSGFISYLLSYVVGIIDQERQGRNRDKASN